MATEAKSNPAREILTQMQQELPEERRRDFAVSAWRWYAELGLFEEGAHQASLAGDQDAALRLAESSLRQMTLQGVR